MRTLDSFSDDTWDRFFDWLAEAREDMPIEEVRRELREAGIDTSQTAKRVRQLIDRHIAQRRNVMDDKGYWHPSEREQRAQKTVDEIRHGQGAGGRERPVIEIGIGEMVSIVKHNGERLMATFDVAEKNRVTLAPQDSATPRPYLELAENVQLERASGESVRAQVWDNRNGKIILRTLPI